MDGGYRYAGCMEWRHRKKQWKLSAIFVKGRNCRTQEG